MSVIDTPLVYVVNVDNLKIALWGFFELAKKNFFCQGVTQKIYKKLTICSQLNCLTIDRIVSKFFKKFTNRTKNSKIFD